MTVLLSMFQFIKTLDTELKCNGLTLAVKTKAIPLTRHIIFPVQGDGICYVPYSPCKCAVCQFSSLPGRFAVNPAGQYKKKSNIRSQENIIFVLDTWGCFMLGYTIGN